MPLLGNGTESPVLLPYAWNERIITDTLSPSIGRIMQVIILNPVECFFSSKVVDQGVKALVWRKPQE